jgi:hypothetical protein
MIEKLDADEQKVELITAEDAVFEMEAVAGDAAKLAAQIKRLGERLRLTLPDSQANDVGRQLDELGAALHSLVDGAAARIRDCLMQWGIPLDDVACDRCGAPDFARQDCGSCCAIRSDGLLWARRLAGWMI